MWKKIEDSPPYYLLFTQKNDYEVFITDFVSIWYIYFLKANFLARLKNDNPLLDDIDEDELINNGNRILLNPDDLKRLEISTEGKQLVIVMVKSFGYPVKLKLKLNEGSKELFFQKITQPLLRTMSDLKLSQEELRFLLRDKDNVIDEYKNERGEITLRYIKSKPTFNDEAHMNKYNMYEHNFGSTVIPKCLLEKTVNVLERNNSVNQEPINNTNHNVKVELDNVVSEAQSPNTSEITARINVKQEIIKTESQSSGVTTRKRPKKLLNY